MKLMQSTKTRLVFHLSSREKQSLLQLLTLYPWMPSTPPVLSKTGRVPDAEANQQLLNDALAEHRAANKQQLQDLLANPRRFKTTDKGARLSLSPCEVETLLQVLNDIRVGSWVVLGSPDKKPAELTAANAPAYLTMEMAGYFQMQLVEALDEVK
jgi:hypothetical protein